MRIQACTRAAFRVLSSFDRGLIAATASKRNYSCLTAIHRDDNQTNHLPTNRRSFSTNQDEEDSPEFRLPFHSSGLGLEPSLISPHMEMMRQLPEIDTALKTISSASIENLNRAGQIFESMHQPGGEYTNAVLALKAEYLHRLGHYEEAEKILNKLGPAASLGLAKNLWYHGKMDQVVTQCESIMERGSIQRSTLHYGAALNGLGMAKLITMETMDDGFSVRDPFRRLVKALEEFPYLIIPIAAAYNNLGVAEAAYALLLSKERGEAPWTRPLKAWSEARNVLRELSVSDRSKPVVKALKAKVLSNIAWAVLFHENYPDYIHKSSEYSRKGLKLFNSGGKNAEGLRRVLSVTAAGYHLAENAVTSEGIFQSAIDHAAIGPLEQIELRDTYYWYAALCLDWEKRDSDAKRLRQKGHDLEDALPGDWSGKDWIYSGLWFWNPSDFD